MNTTPKIIVCIYSCMMTMLFSSLHATPALRSISGDACFPPDVVTVTTSLGSRVTLTIPDQAPSEGPNVLTVTSECDNSGKCHSITTAVIGQSPTFGYCYDGTWPVLTITVEGTADKMSTAGVYNADPNQISNWRGGINIFIAGDSFVIHEFPDCKNFHGNIGTQPLVICPNRP